MSKESDNDDLWNFTPLRRLKTKLLHSSVNNETYSCSQNKGKTANYLGPKLETSSFGIKKEKDDEYDCTFDHFRGSSNFSTPVKKPISLSQIFNNSKIKNQNNSKSFKKSPSKFKSTPKVRKKLSSLSLSTQATLSIENQKLIITPPKSHSYNTSKQITPIKPLLKSPSCSSVTKTLPYFHCDNLSPHTVQKHLNTSSKLLNALDSEKNLTYQVEKNTVCSPQAVGSGISLGNVSNSLRRKELGEPSKRQLFLSDDNKSVSKPSSPAISDIAETQELFTPTEDKLSTSAFSAHCSSDTTESYEDSDFVSPMSVPDSPYSSTSTITFDIQEDDFYNISLSSSPVKDVDTNLPFSDSGVTCETLTKSQKVNEFSSLKDNDKIFSQVVNASNKTPLKKKPLVFQKRVTSKSKLQKANFCSPRKLCSTSKQTNLKNKSTKTSQYNQTSLMSFFQSNISSKEISKSVSVPFQTTCSRTVNKSSVNESFLVTDDTTVKKSLSCSSPKEEVSKTALSLDQFKQLFHKPPVKQQAVTTESSTPTSSSLPTLPVSENYQERKFYVSRCPFYKKIPGTNITVDAFKYGVIQGCCAYFLTHFHYDHYQGLTKNFCQPLYCSEVTANLVKLKIGVLNQYIHPLPLYCPVIVESVEVTLMDANHCPGSVLILFKYSDQNKQKVVLHTGDFRADSIMEKYNALQNVKINQLYLDTTYCDPNYMFPEQQEVLDFCVSLVKSFLKENPQTLVVVGTYTIGKEKVFLALAEAIGSKIGVTQEKKKLLDCLQNLTMDKLLTLDLKSCSIHVVKMGNLNYKNLNEHLKRYAKFNQILALKPTGWTHSKNRTSLFDIKPSLKTDKITIYGIPYSEHSSFSELKRFVQFSRPDNIIPTVNNGKAASRQFMQDTFNSWLSE
ncbi:DNA cross-link repair 1A protein isoform X2 [Octopus sinensis]|uniref:DNA cross-link repair 1A protein n=1 Tax=Octopus sinensis TaxID=2607531 RepID=A0A7E6EID2_9MOLL|nr:DNA cross-link repair 1A protein isoform X2 [Octopus sinensis]